MAIVLLGAGGGAACKSANLHEQQFCMSSAAHSRLQPTHQRRQAPAFICTAQPSGAPASSQPSMNTLHGKFFSKVWKVFSFSEIISFTTGGTWELSNISSWRYGTWTEKFRSCEFSFLPRIQDKMTIHPLQLLATWLDSGPGHSCDVMSLCWYSPVASLLQSHYFNLAFMVSR